MIVDLYLVYQFLKRLTMSFDAWPSFKTGVINDKGEILIKKKDRTREQNDSFGKFDLMILKLKKLLAKIPGGSSKLASYAAALWLIKENNEYADEALMEQQLMSYMNYIKENVDVNKKFDLIFEDAAIVNSVGLGKIDGIGVGPKGEPGISKSAMTRYKKKNIRSFKDTI
jgi:hypothetical protein